LPLFRPALSPAHTPSLHCSTHGEVEICYRIETNRRTSRAAKEPVHGHDQQGDHPAYDTPLLARSGHASLIERGRIHSRPIDHIAGKDRHSFTVDQSWFKVRPTAHSSIERPPLSISYTEPHRAGTRRLSMVLCLTSILTETYTSQHHIDRHRASRIVSRPHLTQRTSLPFRQNRGDLGCRSA
jgi:hypothetical protein